MHLSLKIIVTLLLSSFMSGCINAHKYGFVNEIDGAYTITKDIITPDKPTTGCDSLSKEKKQNCQLEASQLLNSINEHSEK